MHTKEMVQKVMLSIFIKQLPLKSTPGEIFYSRRTVTQIDLKSRLRMPGLQM